MCGNSVQHPTKPSIMNAIVASISASKLSRSSAATSTIAPLMLTASSQGGTDQIDQPTRVRPAKSTAGAAGCSWYRHAPDAPDICLLRTSRPVASAGCIPKRQLAPRCRILEWSNRILSCGVSPWRMMSDGRMEIPHSSHVRLDGDFLMDADVACSEIPTSRHDRHTAEFNSAARRDAEWNGTQHVMDRHV